MFNNYKIINENGEKTLILYVDYSYEFGIDLRKHNRNSNMKNEIKKFIKKINFNGEKLVFMIGGIALATILVVEKPKDSKNIDLIYVADNILPITEIVDYVKKEEVEKVENVIEEEKEEEKNVKISEKKVEKSINDQNQKNNIIDNKESVIKQEINYSNNLENNDEKVDTSKQMVKVYRKNGTILEIELEEYLIGVVGSEMPASFNIEALKAQAVISRTYALKSIEINRKLTDDVTTQTYKDNNELRKIWGDSYDKYYNKVKDAVYSTKGLAIYYNNKYIDAVFHSTSNGKTEDASYVWNNNVPYLKSVDSNWDINASSYLKIEEKSLDTVLNILGIDTLSFNIISRDESGRVSKISIGDKMYTGVEFRNILGLRSADFDIEVEDNIIKFTTRGYGHGVGLSQYGANGMAIDGYNYLSIIKHYYVGVEVK